VTVFLKTKTNFRRRAALAAAISVIGLAGAAHPQAWGDPVDLQVVDRETGQVLPVWRHHGRLYVAGRPGARYGLRVTNHTDGRVLVVMSVDGVNVLSGETAGWDQRGYVFDPQESYAVTGWRKSDTEVAAFTFAALPDSYAARTGRPTDVGVIGIAVFKEKSQPQPEPQASAAAPPRPAPWSMGRFAPRPAPPPAPLNAPPTAGGFAARRAAPAAEAQDRAAAVPRSERPDEKLGTAHGAREWSVVTTVAFERATSYPQYTRQIEYDTYARLAAAGVIRPYADAERHPRPFPAHPDGEGYVPDPPDDP